MLDFFIQDDLQRPVEDIDRPTTKESIRASFLRRLCVATSRPRHLLCLAIHNDHISTEQIDKLIEKGWEIQVVKTDDA